MASAWRRHQAEHESARCSHRRPGVQPAVIASERRKRHVRGAPTQRFEVIGFEPGKLPEQCRNFIIAQIGHARSELGVALGRFPLDGDGVDI